MEYIAFIAGIAVGADIINWRWTRMIGNRLLAADRALARNAELQKQQPAQPQPWAIGRVRKIKFSPDGIAHIELDGGIGFRM